MRSLPCQRTSCQHPQHASGFLSNNDAYFDFLIDGVENGFKIINQPPHSVSSSDQKNYSRALCGDAKPLLDSLFCEELALGRIARQHEGPLRIQAIGGVRKKGSNAYGLTPTAAALTLIR